jgi:hypothetical protein
MGNIILMGYLARTVVKVHTITDNTKCGNIKSRLYFNFEVQNQRFFIKFVNLKFSTVH